MRLQKSLSVFALLLLLMPLAANTDAPCTIDISSAPTPIQLVERASLIAHVRALGYCRRTDAECGQLSNALVTNSNPQGAPEPASRSSVGVGANGVVEFELIEVLKGPTVKGTVRVSGTLVEQDDFNDQQVPYNFIRPGGRSGNCFAFGYRTSREYLLFMRPGRDYLTPYWSALKPTNEQVQGKQDPWVAWVRRTIAGK